MPVFKFTSSSLWLPGPHLAKSSSVAGQLPDGWPCCSNEVAYGLILALSPTSGCWASNVSATDLRTRKGIHF